jgi:hypothetical protein
MAIISTELEGKVTLILNNGTDVNGNTLTKSKTYTKVKPTAADEDLYTVAAHIASLQDKPVISVRKTEEFDLVDMP